MPHFKIRPGESFRMSDGQVKAGGETIELDADMAQLHRDKIDPIAEPDQAPAPAAQAE